jgi:uncharacterized membrane protein YoaK (UPF0700 family)
VTGGNSASPLLNRTFVANMTGNVVFLGFARRILRTLKTKDAAS